MNEKLYIPKKINVGFQLREDTYTGKLAYIIYWDDKGKLRKEKSWNSWRHKPEYLTGGRWDGEKYQWVDQVPIGDQVAPQAFDNVPTEGFVLNKGVGGARESWGWNARNEYIRVYDPRDFEFEISVANLLFILQECSAIKGKGLEGQFVYSWQGTELVLLPVDSYEYEQSSKHTGLQAKKVTKADMTEGCQYIDKEGRTLVYLGRHEHVEFDYYDFDRSKKHIFYHVDHAQDEYTVENDYEDYLGNKIYYIPERGFTKLAEKTSDEPVSNYADLLEEYMTSKHHSPLSAFVKENIEPDWGDLKKKKRDSYSYDPHKQEEICFKYFDKLYRGTIQYRTLDSSLYSCHPHFELKFKYELKESPAGIEIKRSNKDSLTLSEEEIKKLEYFDIKYKLGTGKILTHNQYLKNY